MGSLNENFFIKLMFFYLSKSGRFKSVKINNGFCNIDGEIFIVTSGLRLGNKFKLLWSDTGQGSLDPSG